MKLIIPPISPNATDNEVSNLQDALLFLLSKRIVKTYQPPNSPTEEELHQWTEMLKQEQASSLFGEGTYKLVFNFQLQQGLGDNLRGVVEEKTAARLNELLTSLGAFDPIENGFLVKGVIRQANGAPYEKVTVQAFDKDLRTEELIGEAITDGQGSYEIRYTYQHISNAEQEGADILVRVLDENGNLLATSDIFYNAPAEQTINLTVFPGHEGPPSEWEIIHAQLLPLLKNQKKASRGKYIDLPAEELEGADIEFLHHDTGIEINHIRFWALAHTLAIQVENIPAEAFYGWLREGLPEQPENLWKIATDELIDRLKQAITEKIIPVSIEDLLEQIKATIEQIRTDIENKPLLEQTAIFASDFGNRQDLSEAFTKIYLDHKGDWSAIKPIITNSTTFPKALAGKLFFTQDLMDWSDRNPVVMTTFQQDDATHSLWDIGLQFNKAALSKKIPASAVPATDTKETFTDHLYNSLYANEPTAVVVNMINDPKVPLWNHEMGGFISGLLSKNPDFNIKTTSVYELINNKDSLKNVPEAKKEQVIKDVKTLQRVTLLSAVPEAVPALINNNYISAYTITELPPAQFVATMIDTGLPEETLAHMYAEAENRKVFNEQTLIKIKEAGEKTGIRMIDGEFGNNLHGIDPETLAILTKNNLSWDLLFADADFCECRECTSVYSAAAYYVDLLQYLRNNNLEAGKVKSDPKDITNTPLQKLFARRPDLGHLELSCKNTNTILPYVDLVNEVMEQYVAYKTTQAFNVADETSGELLSAPQHTEQEHAYQTLKEAVFPFTLPYHQPMDAARIFLNHLNSSRYELMNTFRAARDTKKAMEPTKEGGGITRNPIKSNENETLDTLYEGYLQRAIDAEFLNINPEEYFTLTKEVFVSKEYWDNQFFVRDRPGIHTEAEYLNKIGITPLEKYYGYDSKSDLLSTDEAKKIGLTFVKAQFLPRTGIAYTDLVALLKTQYMNPIATSGQIVLTNTGTCNLDQVRLQVGTAQLAEGRYDKIHRFIRLWRRLGFTMDETDKAIMALGNGNITPALIHQLASVKKIMSLTGIELTKLLCFWGDMGTTGENALYQRLFLSHNVLAIDDVFKANQTGAYLTGTPQKISEHLPSVMAALNVSADDIAAVKVPDELTITNLSILYRYRLLSKVVGLRIPVFVHILPLFSDPFANADATLQFLETWTAIENAGFSPQQLNFIIRDVDDERKPFTPSQKSILQVTKTLYDGLNAIDQLHQDLQQINIREQSSSELVRTKASLLTDTGTVEKIIGLLEGTTEFTTKAPKNLDITVPDTKTIKKKLKYDKTLGFIQVTGILTETESIDYNALTSNNGSWNAARARIEKQQDKLFKELLSGIFENEKTGTDPTTKAQLKATIQAGDISIPVDKIPQGQEDTNTASKKRMAFWKIYLPYLRQELSRRFVVDTLSGFTGSDAEITDVLISEVLTSGTSAAPIYNIFEKIKESSQPVENNWEGYLVPAIEAVYTFIVSNSDTNPDVSLDGVALSFTVQEDPTNEWWSAEVRLKAGKLYPLATVGVPLKNLFWKTPASSIAHVPSTALIPDFASNQCEPALSALQKAVMLASTFDLSPDEIRFLDTNKADFDK